MSLSTLLNVIDSVALQEGWVLIITTNYIIYLNEALIQPSCVDKKFKLRLADKKMTADLFCVVFKPIKGNVALLENAQLDVLVRLRENRKVYEATRIQEEEVKRVERLAIDFTARVPELKFSPAEILSFLIAHRQSPREAIDNVEIWMAKITQDREKANDE